MGRIACSWRGKLPVEKRLSAFAVKPNIIVKMQVVSIAVAGIDLLEREMKSNVKMLLPKLLSFDSLEVEC